MTSETSRSSQPSGQHAPLLSVRDLGVSFHTRGGSIEALSDVSFDLRIGETLGIVGESGSGKSVLSRTIMGLTTARNAEVRGSIRFADIDTLTASRRARRKIWGRKVAMVFQDTGASLNPVMKIGNQLIEAIRRQGRSSRPEAWRRGVQLLGEVGVSDAAKRMSQYPHELSGGMRQRVMIAMAISGGPQLLIADEPTTALDVTVQDRILELFDRLRDELGMALILVSHDFGVVAQHCENVIVMYAGRVAEAAPTAELFEGTRMPYTEALLKAIPNMADPPHTPLTPIVGRPPNMIAPPSGCRFHPRCPYAQEACERNSPPLVADPNSSNHVYACWHPIGITPPSDPHSPSDGVGEVGV